jgi:hypothetical protein
MSDENDLPSALRARDPARLAVLVRLDADHLIEWVRFKGDTFDGETGGVFWHRRPSNADGWCCGSFFLRQPPIAEPPVPLWACNSRDPLDLTPSFLCHCGHHGWVRNGKWVNV